MSDVPLTALQVNEALASGESDRIVATLEALAASARRGEFVEVAPRRSTGWTTSPTCPNRY